MPAPAKKFSQSQNFQPNPDPTPEQIAERSAEVRATWTPYDFYRRSGGRRMDQAEFERQHELTPHRLAVVECE